MGAADAPSTLTETTAPDLQSLRALLADVDEPPVLHAETLRRLREGFPADPLLIADLDSILYDDAREVLDKRVRNLTKAKVPDDLAYRVSALNILAAGFDLIRISDTCGIGLAEVAPVYFDIGRRLGLAFLRDSAGRMPTANHWQKQAVAAIIDDLYALQSDLTQRVVQSAEEGTPWDEVAEAWLQKRAQPVERIDQLIAELRALDHVDVSMLAVANRRLRGLMAG